MQKYISTDEVAKGVVIDNIQLPPIDKNAQTQLRSKRKIKSTKICGRVYYLPIWIKEYIDKNTIEVA